MLTKEKSYIGAVTKIDYIIARSNQCVPEMVAAANEIDTLIKLAQRYKTPYHENTERSMKAIALSILACMKANDSNLIALKSQIVALNKIVSAVYYS